MSRILYLFLYQHGEDTVPGITAEQQRQALEQWKWIENEIKKLPVPQRAYFDTLHEDKYEETVDLVRCAIDRKAAPETLAQLPLEIQLMIQLTKWGAMIESTEAFSLVTEYRTFVKEKVCVRNPREGYLPRYFELLDKRDHFIADQIHKTLREGETGFLFQGGNHAIYPFLRADIALGVYLGHLKPRKRGGPIVD